MKKAIIKVYWDRNYSAAPANDDICVVVAADKLDELKKMMEYSLGQHLLGMQEDGDPIPEEFTGEYELEYHLDVRALLRYTEKEAKVSRAALARVSGINQRQLGHYASGWRNPRPDMQERIVEGIRTIGKQLLAAVSL